MDAGLYHVFVTVDLTVIALCFLFSSFRGKAGL